ncbi:hypothetical protein [uncultured Pontibacter sp.]|uniref:hypothetical protein n=1 Tax=uncultured Pontibacter sp. TaxID=453356 RepID=UPI0026376625|nr:hypothetical protein [uncultured Pontibacter sp.]
MKNLLLKLQQLLFRFLYPLAYPLLILVHIIHGAWAVGLLAFFGLVPNEKPSYFIGIPIVVVVLFYFYPRPKRKKDPVQNTPPLGTLPPVGPPVNFPTDPSEVFPSYPSGTSEKGGAQ